MPEKVSIDKLTDIFCRLFVLSLYTTKGTAVDEESFQGLYENIKHTFEADNSQDVTILNLNLALLEMESCFEGRGPKLEVILTQLQTLPQEDRKLAKKQARELLNDLGFLESLNDDTIDDLAEAGKKSNGQLIKTVRDIQIYLALTHMSALKEYDKTHESVPKIGARNSPSK